MMQRMWRESCRFLVVGICLLSVIESASAQVLGQRGIRIVVVRGDRAKNIVQQIAPEPLVVRVEDAGQRPVVGASVTFTAPRAGPGGQFANGSPTVTTPTDADGLAVVEAYHPNGISGSYQILVRAEFQGEAVTSYIRQTNGETRKGHGKLIVIMSVAGAAVGAALIAGNHGDNNTSTDSPISFGDSAVGAPKR